MGLLVAADPRFADHLTGTGHPERPARLDAVLRGIEAPGLAEAVTFVAPRPASDAELARVHDPRLIEALEGFAAAGGGALDPDTFMGPDSVTVARLAAGAGIELVDRLRRGEGDAGFCAVRPPGHHATATRAMGFCLFNNIAVTAAALAEAGERVLIVDYDAHHGNGTEAIFWRDPRVLYVSLHEYPLYPGTGALRDTGEGAGAGATINVPVPRGATGDVYRAALGDLVAPASESHGTTWLLVSAGFDAHRADPLTGLGLSAGDFGDFSRDLMALAPAGRRIFFLEGGYDLDALASSTGAALSALVDLTFRPEPPTSGGPGADVVRAAHRLHLEARAADGAE